MTEDQKKAMALIIYEGARLVQLAGDVLGKGVPVQALTPQAARFSAALNVGVRLGIVDFELHDALAEMEVGRLAVGAGITLPS